MNRTFWTLCTIKKSPTGWALYIQTTMFFSEKMYHILHFEDKKNRNSKVPYTVFLKNVNILGLSLSKKHWHIPFLHILQFGGISCWLIGFVTVKCDWPRIFVWGTLAKPQSPTRDTESCNTSYHSFVQCTPYNNRTIWHVILLFILVKCSWCAPLYLT